MLTFFQILKNYFYLLINQTKLRCGGKKTPGETIKGRSYFVKIILLLLTKFSTSCITEKDTLIPVQPTTYFL